MEIFDQLAIDHDDAFTARRRRCVSLDNLPRPSDIFRFGSEDLVTGADLLRVDEGLAVEAEFVALPTGEFEAGFVVQVEINPVENGEPGSAGSQQAQAERHHERQAFVSVGTIQLLSQIGGAHYQTFHAWGRFGDALRLQDTARGFHHRPDRHRIRGTIGTHDRFHMPDGIGAFDLGQQQGIGARFRRHGDVFITPFGGEGIDANDDFAQAETAGGHRFANLLAGEFLGIRGDGVLQVEDQAVGGQGAGFVQGAGVGARHIQHAATGTRGFGHRYSPLDVVV